MKYVFTLKFPTREQSQLWLEETFDLSYVQILGIWPSPMRAQFLAKVEVTMDSEVTGSFTAALDRMRNIYPEEKRILLYWEEIK